MRVETLFLLILTACGGDKAPGGDTAGSDDGGDDDGNGGGGGCSGDGHCDGWEICESNTCVDGDRNNSPEEAEELTNEGEAVTGWINPEGDADYYTLGSAGEEFVRIAAISDLDAFEDGDLAIVLYDPAGEVLASSTGFPTGGEVSNWDAAIFAYLADPGTYMVEVRDVGDYEGSGGQGDPDYEYEVEWLDWSNHTQEPDAFDEAGASLSPDAARTWYPVGVLLEEEGDADFVELDLPWTGGLTVAGIVDLTGSDATPRVRVLDSEGEEVIAKDALGLDGALYHPRIESGEYILELSDVEGGGGPRHWFFIFVILDEESAVPVEEEPNDDAPTATRIDLTELTTDDGSEYDAGAVLGFADQPADADWYAVEGRDDGYLVVCLNSAIYGSSIAPDIAVYDPEGNLVDSDGGSALTEPNAVIENVPVTADDWYVVVQSPDDAAGTADEWYMFYVFVASFYVDGYACP